MKKIELESKKLDKLDIDKSDEVSNSVIIETIDKKFTGVVRNKNNSFLVTMRHYKKSYRATFQNEFHAAHQYDLWLIDHRKEDPVNCISKLQLEGFAAQNGLPKTRTLPKCISLMPNGKYHAEKVYKKKRHHIGYFESISEAEAELARFQADPDNWQLPKRGELPRYIRYDERYRSYSFRKVTNQKDVWRGPFATLQEAENALHVFLNE
jgi:hypothetical protein